MFPTFTHLTAQYPRRFLIVSMSLFVIGTLQWATYMVGTNPSGEVAQENSSQHTESEVDILQEQFAILDSLKNKGEDTTTAEEKQVILASLLKDAHNTLSIEEQKQLLEKLK